jgi:serine/threonine-protein kinase RsbT
MAPPPAAAQNCNCIPVIVRVRIDSDRSILEARQRGRALAEESGFGIPDLAMIATAISELARNTLRYAQSGDVLIRTCEQDGRRGVMIVASDQGPGIGDVALALQDGYSTSGGLGLGLPGVKRLMDEFEIISESGRGTTVTAIKWKK